MVHDAQVIQIQKHFEALASKIRVLMAHQMQLEKRFPTKTIKLCCCQKINVTSLIVVVVFDSINKISSFVGVCF